MLKIGEFSKVCQVSVKALRHWDSVGLLKPAITDADTSYRSYDISQVAEVHRVLAFRAMGLSLSQIADLLRDHPGAEDIRAMLRLKQVELAAEIEQSQRMLALVETRLADLDMPDRAPYEVALKSAPQTAVLAIRETLPSMDALVTLLAETDRYARGVPSTLMAVFHDSGFEVADLDVEVGFAADTSLRSIPLNEGRALSPVTLPAVETLATTVHHGPWVGLPRAYAALGRWIDQNGYVIAGSGREVFHAIGWDTPNTTVTELQFPVMRAGQSS
jgi:DNA-binding transcriptional MerR regulator